MTKTPFLLKLGKRVAAIRKEKGMNQYDLEAASGKMINTISNIERGLFDVKVTTLLEIAKAFDISLADLIDVDAPLPKKK